MTKTLRHIMLRREMVNLTLSQKIITYLIPLPYSGAFWERFTSFQIASIINILIIVLYSALVIMLLPLSPVCSVRCAIILDLYFLKLFLIPFRYLICLLIIINYIVAFIEYFLEKTNKTK